MRTQAALRAPNSLVLVVTDDAAEVPVALDLNGIAGHSQTCIAVGTVAEGDAEVEVVLTDEMVADDQLSLADETELDASSGFVAVETVTADRLLSASVPGPSQRVRVWVSDPREPDRIVIELVNVR